MSTGWLPAAAMVRPRCELRTQLAGFTMTFCQQHSCTAAAARARLYAHKCNYSPYARRPAVNGLLPPPHGNLLSDAIENRTECSVCHRDYLDEYGGSLCLLMLSVLCNTGGLGAFGSAPGQGSELSIRLTLLGLRLGVKSRARVKGTGTRGPSTPQNNEDCRCQGRGM